MSAEVNVDLDEGKGAGHGDRLVEAADALLDSCDLAQRELSILLTDDDGIRALNLRWRNVDQPTDVLSFAFDEVDDQIPGLPLGDIAINIDQADAQRSEHGLTLDEELIFLLVHGFCHLRGYDHLTEAEATKMRAEEERLLREVRPTLSRPETFF